MSNVAQEVRSAEARIRPYVRETPVEVSHVLGGDRVEVWLKLENLQMTGSFKLRGAVNKLLSLTAEERRRGVVAASTGNHGAAVAYALHRVGGRGLVFVPETASETKLAAIRSWGVEIRKAGDDGVIAERAARRFSEEEGLPYVSPYNDPLILAGQGTIGVELERQLERVDTLYVALGGGGLISGVAGYLKTVSDVEVVACSPENSPVMYESLRAGEILDLESQPTLSDGTAGGVEEGAITFDICRRVIDRHVLVTEEEIREAMVRVIGGHHTLVEGAAGVAVAGFLKERARLGPGTAAILLCGANVSVETLRSVL